MAQRLKKIKVNEVSLVTRPAIAKEFLLYKSMDGETMENEEIVKAETTEVVEAETEAVEKGKDKKEKKPKPVKKEDEAEVEKKGEPVCKKCGKVHKEEEPCPVKKEEEPISKEEELSKALEAIQVEKAALAAKVEELEKAAYAAKQTEITKAFVEKAATELKHVPTVVAAKFGPVLKSASEKLAKEEYDAIYAALVGAEAFIKSSSLTKELGVGGEDLSAEPAAQLDAIAKSIQDKDPALSHAQAFSKACDLNPQLYNEHVRAARRR
jgi:hypothetical protein